MHAPAPIAAPLIGAGPALSPAPAPYVRTSFTLDAAPVSATLRYTALGIVEPWLNGHRVGDEVLAPGWTSYRHRLLVSEVDVTALLVAGENALGAIVGNGWACGHLSWNMKRGVYHPWPAASLALRCTFADGSTTDIVTSPGWRVGTGAVLSDDLYDGEHYDARLCPDGWSEPGFDDSAWPPAAVADWDPATLEPRSCEPVRRTQVLAPVAITIAPSGATIVDFGQNLSGWVRLRVCGEAGRRITLRHGELLTPAGELETVNLRNARATDSYTLRGPAGEGSEGVETWEPRFTFHGFRYAEVSGWPGALTPDAVEAVVVHTDLTRTGWLETSDPLLNQLHENTVWGMRGNFVSLPTDCPQRDERLGWTGDINVFGPTAAALYDVRGLLGSWLTDVVAEHAALGWVPFYVPDVDGVRQAHTAVWGDVVVSLPYALYTEYGDPDVLRRTYPSMLAYVGTVEAELDDRGVWSSGYQFGDWLDPDAPADRADLAKADRFLVATAYFHRVCREVAEVAHLLGHDDDAARLDALARRVREGFRAEYVTASGRMVDESPTACALALRFGLLDADQERRVGAKLAQKVAEAGYHIATGFAGTPHVLDALVQTGHHHEAFRLLMQTTPPSFLYPITMGATTIWERWDSVLPDGTLHPASMTSLNHYALGAVTGWMHRAIGGLTPLAPGYARVRVAPLIGGGLTGARLVRDTPHGRVEVAWRLDDGHVTLDVTLPAGVTALVVPPGHPDGVQAEVTDGVHAWSYALPALDLPAVDLDSPLDDLLRHPGGWSVVEAVLLERFPFLTGRLTEPRPGGETGGRSVRWLLGNIPGMEAGTEGVVAAALARLA